MSGSADEMAGTGTPAEVFVPQDSMANLPARASGRQAETTTDDEGPSSFHEAYQKAKAQHAKAAEQETVVADADATDTKDTKVDASTAETKDTPAETALISDSDFKALQAKHAKDPVALLGELNKAFTQKTQALSADRKTYERVRPYVELIDAYEEHPAETLKVLAEQNGFTLTPKGTAATTTGDTTAETTAAVDDVLTDFRESLGPELEYLADGLAPAITKLVERLAEKQVAPLKAHQAKANEAAAETQTKVIFDSFGEKHPDWKDHEPAMLQLAERIQPAKGMTETDWLDHLYATATRDAWEKDRDTKIAEGVKKHLAALRKGAETTEPRAEATPESQVRKRPTESVSFRQAYEDAKRGVVYQD